MRKIAIYSLLMLFFISAMLPLQAVCIAGSVTYIYDDAGRLKKARYSSGKTIEYSYDEAGNLLQWTVVESGTGCKVESLAVSVKKLILKKNESKELTVVVNGDEDCQVEGELVTTQLSAADKKRISISPTEQATDESGNATFTITAANKGGNATVKFKCSGKTTTLNVKVGK